MSVILEFDWRWPFVKRRLPVVSAPFAPASGGPHLSWVKTDVGVGFLHHHESNGWIVQLSDGRLIKRDTYEFENLPAKP